MLGGLYRVSSSGVGTVALLSLAVMAPAAADFACLRRPALLMPSQCLRHVEQGFIG